jgi:hypothetical protein
MCFASGQAREREKEKSAVENGEKCPRRNEQLSEESEQKELQPNEDAHPNRPPPFKDADHPNTINPVEAAKEGRWDDVKKYLQDNHFLTVYELAIEFGKSPSTVRNWRRRCGLSGKYPFKTRPTNRKKNVTVVKDKSTWDNAEWFEQQYTVNGHGIAMIAKMIDRSPRLVVLRLKKYGIETRSHSQAVRSNNPCADGKWLLYHYGTRNEYEKETENPDSEGGKEWSLKRCAEAAGVVPATIYNWLVRANKEGFQINIRDLNEAVAGHRNPFYGKKHSEETKERLRQSSRAYIKSRTKKSAKLSENSPAD